MAKRAKTEPEVKMFPDLKWFEDDEEKPAAPKAEATSQEALLAEIANLRGQVENAKRTTAVLSSQPVQAARPNLSTEPDWKDMPDPTLEPEKYQAEVGRRWITAMENKRRLEDFDNQQANAQRNKYDTLWEDFQSKYPKLKDKRTLVEAYAVDKARNLQARQVDVEKYIFSDPDGYFKEIVAAIKADTGLGHEEDDETEDEKPDTRTGGFVGVSTSRAQAEPKKEQPDNDMFAALREVKRKEGWY